MHTEETPAPALHRAVAFPLPARLAGIPGVQPLDLEVVEVSELGARMRRILLASGGLRDFAYRAGQDVMLVLGGTPDRPLSRRYSIRRLDPQNGTVELNIVTHGVHGPGAAWAASVQVGDRVDGVGPRGKVFIDPEADWHLFLGDESAAPATLNMLEALPPSASGVAYLEVASTADELPAAHEVRWLHRGEVPAISSTQLAEALASVALPSGRGHVYIAGEVQVVAGLQRAALARGLAPEQIFAKAYWGRGKANADRGEPD